VSGISAASVYELQDAAQGWKNIAGNLSPNGLGAARRTSHGKIVIRVAQSQRKPQYKENEL
jgi:hypothetical protein